MSGWNERPRHLISVFPGNKHFLSIFHLYRHRNLRAERVRGQRDGEEGVRVGELERGGGEEGVREGRGEREREQRSVSEGTRETDREERKEYRDEGGRESAS